VQEITKLVKPKRYVTWVDFNKALQKFEHFLISDEHMENGLRNWRVIFLMGTVAVLEESLEYQIID
jgi:hypothetical protein